MLVSRGWVFRYDMWRINPRIRVEIEFLQWMDSTWGSLQFTIHNVAEMCVIGYLANVLDYFQMV